jgi:hypothetical protein
MEVFARSSLPESLAEVKRISSRTPGTFEKAGVGESSAKHNEKDEIHENVRFFCGSDPCSIVKCAGHRSLISYHKKAEFVEKRLYVLRSYP